MYTHVMRSPHFCVPRIFVIETAKENYNDKHQALCVPCLHRKGRGKKHSKQFSKTNKILGVTAALTKNVTTLWN